MANVLLIYHNRFSFPLRKTTEDYIYSFQKYSSERYFFCNAAFGIPRYLRKVSFDLIIFHATLISDLKWCSLPYDKWLEKYRPLSLLKGEKIVLCQDEFLRTEQVCGFIRDFGVSRVFSVAPRSEWHKIYPLPVFVGKILTGYLEEGDIETINLLARKRPVRDIDIGYRAWKAEPWVGRHGMLKTQIAEKFLEVAPKFNLKVDISTRPEDTLLGFDWYKFLLRCKYTIGVEGGSSILDRDGSIKRKVEEYVQQNPHASFDEVEKACFEGLDGNLSLFALSPRHLEAVATKTCQILIEGEYDGVLRPGRHYIELKRDFSNLEQVLETVKEDMSRQEIVERAYEDIVESGMFSYRNFVETVIGGSPLPRGRGKEKRSDLCYFYLNKLREGICLCKIALCALCKKLLKSVLPPRVVKKLRYLKNKLYSR